ncbi:MAG: autotransporter assembly complex family protein [Pseudomonadota bacterium]
MRLLSSAASSPIARALALMLAILAVPAQADRLVAVTINGLDGPLLINATKFLGIEKLRADGDDRSETFLRYQFSRGEDEIRDALEPFGYYQVTIESRFEARPDGSGWAATFDVDRGPQVVFGEIAIALGEAEGDDAVKQARAAMNLAPGAPFTHAAYEETKRKLQNLLAGLGYFENQLVENRVLVDPEAGTADVTLMLDSGPRYRFGPTRFEGSQFTEAFMSRFGRLPIGEYFDEQELRSLQRNLVQVEYFDDAFVQPQVDEANDQLEVPVVVTTSPNRRIRYTAGINFGTDSGIGVQLRTIRRWVNDRGHSVEGDLEYGTRDRRLTAGYRIPGRDLDTSYLISGGYDYTDTDAYIEEREFVAGTRSRKWGDWNLTETLSYNIENFEVGDQADEQKYLLGAVTAERVRADDRIFTRRGWRIEATVRGVEESLASDFSILQLDVTGQWIRMLGEKNRILLRGRLGTSLADDLVNLPASLRFFTGGDRSVRGFDFESLGPRNDEGEVIGGRHVAVISATAEHYFREKWGIAGFVDAGNAFETDDFTPAFGVGLGARWISPIGLVRVDLAVGIEDDEDNTFRMHLNIGPDL